MTKYEQEAQKLFDAMYNEFPESYDKEQMAIDIQVAKCQAMIAVDLVLKELRTHFIPIVDHINHWQKVKEAIKAIKS